MERGTFGGSLRGLDGDPGRAVLSESRIKWLDVSYEAVVDDTANEIKRIVDFLELDWDERCLKYYEARRSIATASYDQANKKIYTSSVGRWKNFSSHLDLLSSLEN